MSVVEMQRLMSVVSVMVTILAVQAVPIRLLTTMILRQSFPVMTAVNIQVLMESLLLMR